MQNTWIRATLVATAVVALQACAASDDPMHDEESESETAPTEEALVSAVDCTERTETAYVSGSPRSIKVIKIGGKLVSKPTGHAFLKMQKAADAAGVSLSLTSGFRTMAEQQYLYNCYVTQSCNNGNLAARPGYSNHQSGTAVDVSTSTWLANNASKYGFVRTVPSEPWHYEYTGGSDPGGPCGGGATQQNLAWVSPRDGGWYTNGIWMKAKPTKSGVAKVTYWADGYLLGSGTDASQDFAFHYTFNTLGKRSLLARAYDASNKEVGSASIQIQVTK